LALGLEFIAVNRMFFLYLWRIFMPKYRLCLTWTMGRTSIQIDETTLIKLRRKRGSMQAKTGEDITYDNVINYLLDDDKKRHR